MFLRVGARNLPPSASHRSVGNLQLQSVAELPLGFFFNAPKLIQNTDEAAQEARLCCLSPTGASVELQVQREQRRRLRPVRAEEKKDREGKKLSACSKIGLG